MENSEIEKAKTHSIGDMLKYESNSIVLKSILKKVNGSINAFSLDKGETMDVKILPFDTYIQIIDGKAELIIDGISNYLDSGQSIVIPAHSSNIVKANERFKMIATVIKSGYE
jgi:quercetin dioxygenase-like cupin family protein